MDSLPQLMSLDFEVVGFRLTRLAAEHKSQAYKIGQLVTKIAEKKSISKGTHKEILQTFNWKFHQSFEKPKTKQSVFTSTNEYPKSGVIREMPSPVKEVVNIDSSDHDSSTEESYAPESENEKKKKTISNSIHPKQNQTTNIVKSYPENQIQTQTMSIISSDPKYNPTERKSGRDAKTVCPKRKNEFVEENAVKTQLTCHAAKNKSDQIVSYQQIEKSKSEEAGRKEDGVNKKTNRKLSSQMDEKRQQIVNQVLAMDPEYIEMVIKELAFKNH